MIDLNKTQQVAFLATFFLSVAFQTLSQNVTPTQKFFDWTSLQFPKEEYAARRNKLVELLKSSGGGIYLTTSKDGFSSGETFRQLDDFNYFSGLEVPNSILAIDADNGSVQLFVPSTDVRFESAIRKNDFPGRALAEDKLLTIKSGIPNIIAVENFDDQMSDWVNKGRILRINYGRSQKPETNFISTWTQDQSLHYHIQETFNAAKIEGAYSEIASLRMIKSEREIEVLRKSVSITAKGIRKASIAIKDGIDERTLEAELEAEFKRNGAQRLAFNSIIKSGPNSLWPWRILASHYDRRNRKMMDGDLVIFDVGCEYNYYSSDVGRTFPVSGKFTEEQKTILQMEVNVADAIIAAIKPGMRFSDLVEVAMSEIPEDQKQYMQVGVFFGHHIGLYVGDPNLGNVELKAGMVFTVEPYYYNHDEKIAVFTEDVVLVTENGVENLSGSLPRYPDDLENLMNAR